MKRDLNISKCSYTELAALLLGLTTLFTVHVGATAIPQYLCDPRGLESDSCWGNVPCEEEGCTYWQYSSELYSCVWTGNPNDICYVGSEFIEGTKWTGICDSSGYWQCECDIDVISGHTQQLLRCST